VLYQEKTYIYLHVLTAMFRGMNWRKYHRKKF